MDKSRKSKVTRVRFFDEELLFFCLVGMTIVILIYLGLQAYMWITGN